MVEESLIAYLKNKLLHEEAGAVELGKKQIALFGNETKTSQLSLEVKIDESPFKNKEDELDELLHQLVSFSDINPFSVYPEVQRKIIQALDNCKILDPACGSGAYPMGILQKMVHILHKLDPNNTVWKEVQLEKAKEETDDAFEIIDKSARAERLIEINDAFDQNINYPDYARKLFLIENCIYGIDIQPIATQISKLRFFISLVVDQKVDAVKDNFGIRPLPNLEAKFVAANTLIGIEKPQKGEFTGSLFDNREVQKLENELKKIRHKLFSIKTPSIKRDLRQQDKILREKISDLLAPDFGNDTARLLANWDPYDQNASSSFYDTEWMFGLPKINGGFFDIVIGNPPYIKENTDKSVFNGLRKSIYYQGKMDLWYFFACISLDLIKSGGALSFIATNNWITNAGASKLRNKILDDAKINRYVDFSNFKIFESAGIQTMIFILEKNSNNEKYTFSYSKLINSNINFVDLKKFLLKEVHSDFSHFDSQIIKKDFINKTIDFNDKIINDILIKIESKRNFYLDSKTEINSGIDIPQDFVNKSSLEILGNGTTVGDGIFVLSNDEINKLDLNEKEKSLLKPFYTTKELFRYSVSNENKFWIIYTDSSFKDSNRMKEFPNLKAHLDKFQKVITSENKPYGLNRARNEKYFKSEKILIQRKCPTRPSFVYVNFDSYVNRTFIPIKTERIDLKYLVSIMNSNLCQFWLKYKGKMQGDNFQIDKDPILQIPIFKPDDKVQKPFILFVNEILNKKKENIDTSELENKIDKLVYDLYGLNDEEVRIIEQ